MPNIVPYHFICKYLHFPQDRKLNPEIEKAINQVPFLGSEIIHKQKKHASASFFLFNFMKFFRARAANCVFNKIGPIRISLTIYSRLIKIKSFFIMTCMPDFGWYTIYDEKNGISKPVTLDNKIYDCILKVSFLDQVGRVNFLLDRTGQITWHEIFVLVNESDVFF